MAGVKVGWMGTVTIAATYGAGGSVIAPEVAKRLGLRFIDRAIPVSMAEEMHEPLEAALAEDADHTPQVALILDRVLATSGLFVGVTASPEQRGALPEVAATEQTLRRIADTTGAVILGRAGVFALKGVPGGEDVQVQSGGVMMDVASFLALPPTLSVDRVERST